MRKVEQSMGGHMPGWLADGISEALRDLGATAPPETIQKEVREVVAAWDSPDRPAHDVKYLAGLYERLGDFDAVTSTGAALRVATAYLAFAPRWPWEALANWGPPEEGIPIVQRLQALGVAPEEAVRVETLLRQVTSPELPREDFDARILFDAILATAGTSPQRYAKFLSRLREECEQGDPAGYLQARRRYLNKSLDRPRLFLTPFAPQWADLVRENLVGELAQINARLGVDDELPDWTRRTPGAAEKGGGPVFIRRSVRAAVEPLPLPSGAENAPTVPVRREPVSKKTAQLGIEMSKALHAPADDTSTLEAFDDPFSHRRRKK